MSTQSGYAYPGNLEYDRSRRRERVVEPPRKNVVKKKQTAVTASDKRKLLSFIIMIGILGVIILSIHAYCSIIKHDINKINSETAAIQTEIENIQVNIEKARNINTIEQKALNELGMIYPTSDQFVYITGDEEDVQDFAQLIKENAYQVW